MAPAPVRYDADPTQKEQCLHLLRGVRQRKAELERRRRDLELTMCELDEVERETLDAREARGIPPILPPEPEPDLYRPSLRSVAP